MNLLYEIQEELKQCLDSRSSILQSCIEERLNKSVQVYLEDLNLSLVFLSNRNDFQLLKKYARGK